MGAVSPNQPKQGIDTIAPITSPNSAQFNSMKFAPKRFSGYRDASIVQDYFTAYAVCRAESSTITYIDYCLVSACVL